MSSPIEQNTSQRIWLSFLVLALVLMVVAPFAINGNLNDQREAFLSNCYQGGGILDYCSDEKNRQVNLGLFDFALPFIGLVLVLWGKWIFKVDLSLSAHSYPRRTLAVLLFIGMALCSLGVVLSLSTTFGWFGLGYQEPQVGVPLLHHVRTLWIISCVALAPLVFERVCQPHHFSVSYRIAKLFFILFFVVEISNIVIRISEQFS